MSNIDRFFICQLVFFSISTQCLIVSLVKGTYTQERWFTGLFSMSIFAILFWMSWILSFYLLSGIKDFFSHKEHK